MSDVTARLAEAGFHLPPAPRPGGAYAPLKRVGCLIYLSGAIGTVYRDGAWSLPYRGAIGADVSIEEGRASARFCILNHLAALQAELGALETITNIVRLTGYIHAAAGFTKGPLVLDAASELLATAFGSKIGTHSRVAVYQHTMSFGAPLETELIVEAPPSSAD